MHVQLQFGMQGISPEVKFFQLIEGENVISQILFLIKN